MKRILALVCAALVLAACGSGENGSDAVPTAASGSGPIRVDAVPKAVLSQDDLGAGWRKFDLSKVEGCTKIGGKICVENVPGRVSAKTQVAYDHPAEEDGARLGYVSNAVLLMVVEEDARAVVQAFREAALVPEWSQSFASGEAAYALSRLELEEQGDETFAVRINSTARERRTGTQSKRTIDYVVFRDGRALSVLYVIGANTQDLARTSAAKIRALVAGR